MQLDPRYDWDIAVIGAGAAGLAAGIFAAQADRRLRVVLLDGAKQIGAKILVSGGGRCNVTHERVRAEDFNGSKNFVKRVLKAFDHEAAVRWFGELGVALKREETGKLFPVSDRARTVLDALLSRCRSLGVAVRAGQRVERVQPRESGGWRVMRREGEPLTTRRLIMATGGRSLPKTGSDGHGWRMLQDLGHRITETYPALVPLVCGADGFHADLSGLSLPASLTTALGSGQKRDRRADSLLWTHFGISGPVAMDASRHWLIQRQGDASASLRANFLSPESGGEDFVTADAWLTQQAGDQPRRGVARLLGERLPPRLAECLSEHVGVDPGLPAGQLRREDRRRLVHAMTDLDLRVERDRGWNYAEVTAGGIPLAEVDARDMASKRLPDLHIVGEMLDCDGRIGGFNFQWAWATGHLAGQAAAAGCTAG